MSLLNQSCFLRLTADDMRWRSLRLKLKELDQTNFKNIRIVTGFGGRADCHRFGKRVM